MIITHQPGFPFFNLTDRWRNPGAPFSVFTIDTDQRIFSASTVVVPFNAITSVTVQFYRNRPKPWQEGIDYGRPGDIVYFSPQASFCYSRRDLRKVLEHFRSLCTHAYELRHLISGWD